MNVFNNTTKGILFIVGGFVLLLHTIGVFVQWLNTIIIIGSIAMIVYGFVLADYHKKIMTLFSKKQQQKDERPESSE